MICFYVVFTFYVITNIILLNKGVDFMTMKNLNVRVDEELKAKAEEIFSELGMNMSTALNIFLKTAVRYGGIPFELRLDHPNIETVKAIYDVNNNQNMSKTFNSIEEMMVDLNAED